MWKPRTGTESDPAVVGETVCRPTERGMTVAKHPNLFDYLHWRGDLSFQAAPFNEVDNIILSMMTFVDFSTATAGGALADLANAVNAFATLPKEQRYYGVIIPDTVTDMAVTAARTPRFAGTKICRYENIVHPERVEQFSAVTFLLSDGTVFVAYRGTDDTITGWKEDMLLAFTDGVPAQRQASRYLTETAACCKGKIRIGGHSKGGNLSVWAAVNAPAKVRKRILNIYSNDGPGFLPAFVEREDFLGLIDRIVTFVPASSVVGMLLEHGGTERIIASGQKGVLQHDPFSWIVDVDHFTYRKERSKFGRQSDKAVRDWIASMTETEKREFVETFFSVLDATGAETLTQLQKMPLTALAAAQHALSDMDKDKRGRFNALLKRLLLPPKG